MNALKKLMCGSVKFHKALCMKFAHCFWCVPGFFIPREYLTSHCKLSVDNQYADIKGTAIYLLMPTSKVPVHLKK